MNIDKLSNEFSRCHNLQDLITKSYLYESFISLLKCLKPNPLVIHKWLRLNICYIEYIFFYSALYLLYYIQELGSIEVKRLLTTINESLLIIPCLISYQKVDKSCLPIILYIYCEFFNLPSSKEKNAMLMTYFGISKWSSRNLAWINEAVTVFKCEKSILYSANKLNLYYIGLNNKLAQFTELSHLNESIEVTNGILSSITCYDVKWCLSYYLYSYCMLLLPLILINSKTVDYSSLDAAISLLAFDLEDNLVHIYSLPILSSCLYVTILEFYENIYVKSYLYLRKLIWIYTIRIERYVEYALKNAFEFDLDSMYGELMLGKVYKYLANSLNSNLLMNLDVIELNNYNYTIKIINKLDQKQKICLLSTLNNNRLTQYNIISNLLMDKLYNHSFELIFQKYMRSYFHIIKTNSNENKYNLFNMQYPTEIDLSYDYITDSSNDPNFKYVFSKYTGLCLKETYNDEIELYYSSLYLFKLELTTLCAQELHKNLSKVGFIFQNTNTNSKTDEVIENYYNDKVEDGNKTIKTKFRIINNICYINPIFSSDILVEAKNELRIGNSLVYCTAVLNEHYMTNENLELLKEEPYVYLLNITNNTSMEQNSTKYDILNLRMGKITQLQKNNIKIRLDAKQYFYDVFNEDNEYIYNHFNLMIIAHSDIHHYFSQLESLRCIHKNYNSNYSIVSNDIFINNWLNSINSDKNYKANLQIIIGPPGSGKSYTVQKQLALNYTCDSNTRTLILSRSYGPILQFIKRLIMLNVPLHTIQFIGDSKIEYSYTYAYITQECKNLINIIYDVVMIYSKIYCNILQLNTSIQLERKDKFCLSFLRYKFRPLLIQYLYIIEYYKDSNDIKNIIESIDTIYCTKIWSNILKKNIEKYSDNKSVAYLLFPFHELLHNSYFQLYKHNINYKYYIDLLDFTQADHSNNFEKIAEEMNEKIGNLISSLTTIDELYISENAIFDSRKVLYTTYKINFVAMTVSHLLSYYSASQDIFSNFDALVIEEATLFSEYFLYAALFSNCASYKHLNKIYIIADDKQLSPLVKFNIIKTMPYTNISLINRLLNELEKKPEDVYNKLVTKSKIQRRCREEIASLWKWCYNDKLETINTILDNNNSGFKYTVQWVQVDGNEMKNNEKEIYNSNEVMFVVLTALYMLLIGYNHFDIAIISPYKYQNTLIDNLRNSILSDSFDDNLEIGSKIKVIENKLKRIRIGTIDEFQGNEVKFVLLSLVKTKVIGFLSDINRIIVGLSRASHGLYIFGNRQFWERRKEESKFFKNLYTQPTNLIINLFEYYGKSENNLNTKPVIINSIEEFLSIDKYLIENYKSNS